MNVRRWLQAQMEPTRNRPQVSREHKKEILENLIDAELFETFIQSRYPGQKRFSLEGAESLIPAVHAVVQLAPELGIEELVMGMAHRGRLNVLANILDKSYAQIFSEFEDNFLPESVGLILRSLRTLILLTNCCFSTCISASISWLSLIFFWMSLMSLTIWPKASPLELR